MSLDIADTLIITGFHNLEIGSLTKNSNLAWVWTDTTQLEPSTVNGYAYFYSPTDVAFQLYAASNSVPQPATITLLGIGLIGLIAANRKRKLVEKGESHPILPMDLRSLQLPAEAS